MPEERKPDDLMPDELDDYLSGTSRLSRQYRREFAPTPPHVLDRRVLTAARPSQPKSQYLAPLAFAASVFLSVALVLAIIFGPQAAKKSVDAPMVVRVRSYRAEAPAAAHRVARTAPRPVTDVRERTPDAWLADIEALRRAGRDSEADAEMRVFRRIYPDYAPAKP
jgi:negative regulator of sigma E activity